MGVTGPRPKPTAIKQMMGNPGKRPLNDLEPQPTSTAKCPRKQLTKDAIREWKRVEGELTALGLLSDLDRSAMMVYCEAYSTWLKAKGNVKQYGEVVKTKNGNLIQNPYFAIMNRAADTMIRVAAEFGMTPSARTRLAIVSTPGTHVIDPAESYFEDTIQPEPEVPTLQ